MSGASYYRITITGDPGSGKTTFARQVAERTGYRLITTGNMFRELAMKKGISIAALNELAETQQEIDREVDEYIKGLNEAEENLVLDSRMAWRFLREAFKVRLSVDPAVAVERIFNDRERAQSWNDSFPDMETAVEEVRRRRQSEISRYHALYGVDIGDDSNFDLVIDTSGCSRDEIMDRFDSAFAAYRARLLQEA